MSPDKKHIRPSALNDLRVCPQYRPSEGSSPAAQEGTLMHLAMESGDDSGINIEQIEQLTKCRQYQRPYLEAADEIFRELPLTMDMEGDK